ncbi:hypothetical protein EYF80_045442 [Liparis tanakae]|uniref:Uncharacterized protein n=1 Tax=Liparis tanakae TaxID=230148 RepID=A0A4Z2FT20_9TELE|nr:hypothetical protein EYF80_045442 [Liparis tanakae]
MSPVLTADITIVTIRGVLFACRGLTGSEVNPDAVASFPVVSPLQPGFVPHLYPPSHLQDSPEAPRPTGVGVQRGPPRDPLRASCMMQSRIVAPGLAAQVQPGRRRR